MRSLRSQMTLGAVAAAAAILLAAGAILFALIHRTVMNEFDRSLLAQLQALKSQVDVEGGQVRLELDKEMLRQFGPGRGEDYFELWDGSGRVWQRSASLGAYDLARGAPGTVRAVRLPGKRRGRQALAVFQPAMDEHDGAKPPPRETPPPPVTLAVARDATAVNDVLEQIFWGLATVIAATTLGCAAILAGVVTRGLKPLHRLGNNLRGIGEHQLSQRLDAAGVPQELRPVVDGLNQLLAKLDAAFARERSLSADLAHELRTPLFGLRAKLEVALSQPRQAAAYRKTVQDCLAIVLATQGLVENLLALVRLDAGQIAARREPVRLSALLHAVWEPFAERAAARRLRVTWDDDAATVVTTDRERLRLVLSNLFDNAVSYADTGGELCIRAAPDAAAPGVEIANSGSQVAAADGARVFDRFWSGDAARAGVGTHCGLGLALAQRVMELLGHEICVATEAGGWFRVRLRFPAAPIPIPEGRAKNLPPGLSPGRCQHEQETP